MNKVVLALIVVVPLVFAGKILSTEAPRNDNHPPHAVHADRTFRGVDGCKTCHRKPEDGEQFRIWEEGPHAKAYATLASDEAKTLAAEKGIDNPQEAGECLKCHVTAYGVDAALLDAKYTIEDGVGCESCHGPGGDYYKKNTMVAITKGEMDPASVGLILPTEETCTTCHNEESPSFKPFNFEERKKEIAHPIPEAKMAEYQ